MESWINVAHDIPLPGYFAVRIFRGFIQHHFCVARHPKSHHFQKLPEHFVIDILLKAANMLRTRTLNTVLVSFRHAFLWLRSCGWFRSPLHLTRPFRCCMIAVAAWWCFSAFVLIFIASFLPFAGLVLRDDNYDSYGTFRMFCAHHFWNTSWKAWVGELLSILKGAKPGEQIEVPQDFSKVRLFSVPFCFELVWYQMIRDWIMFFEASMHVVVGIRPGIFWGTNSMSPISLCIFQDHDESRIDIARSVGFHYEPCSILDTFRW